MTSPRRLLIALTASLLAVPAAAAQAATHYVSPSGSDSNSGSAPSSPWRSLAKVNATRLSAGDELLFQGGQTFSGELDPNGSGSAGRPITYGSYGNGKATLVQPTGSVNLWLNSQHDITISNLIFDGAGQRTCVASAAGGTGVTALTIVSAEVKNCGAGSTDAIGIHQTNVTADGGWIIRNSYIHDTTDSGMILEGEASPDSMVGNTLNNVGTASGSYGFNAHGIYSKNPGAQILNNDIGHYGTEGVSTRFRNALIQGNYIHDGLGLGGGSDGVGFYSYDPVAGGTSIIRYNRFNNAGSNAIYVTGPSSGAPYNQPESWLIYNNTVAGSSGSPIYFEPDWNGSELAIQNNIFVGGAALRISRIPATYVENHNDGPHVSGSRDTTSNANLSAAPTFVPQKGSPVVQAGTTSVSGTSWTHNCSGAILDYCGKAPDIGCCRAWGYHLPTHARAHIARHSRRGRHHGRRQSRHHHVSRKRGRRHVHRSVGHTHHQVHKHQ